MSDQPDTQVQTGGNGSGTSAETVRTTQSESSKRSLRSLKRRRRRQPGASQSKYRIDFVVMVIAGNIARVNVTKPIVDRDPEVVARWTLIRTWVVKDWTHLLPGMAQIWARHLVDARRAVFGRFPEAMIVHTFETYGMLALRKRFTRSSTVMIYNPDRFESTPFQQTAYQQTELYVPWSRDCLQMLVDNGAPVTEENARVLHPGLDLQNWPFCERPVRSPGDRFQLLYIGGQFELKGGATLIDAFEARLADSCDLTVVTQEPFVSSDSLRRMSDHPNIQLHLDVPPGSGGAKQFYDRADALVLPSPREGLPWVLLEALASGVPVASTGVNGIPDAIIHETTGLVFDVDDADGLSDAVERIRTDADLRARLIEAGRRHVETNFDAAVNTPKLLSWAKALIDERRTP